MYSSTLTHTGLTPGTKPHSLRSNSTRSKKHHLHSPALRSPTLPLSLSLSLTHGGPIDSKSIDGYASLAHSSIYSTDLTIDNDVFSSALTSPHCDNMGYPSMRSLGMKKLWLYRVLGDPELYCLFCLLFSRQILTYFLNYLQCVQCMTVCGIWQF